MEAAKVQLQVGLLCWLLGEEDCSPFLREIGTIGIVKFKRARASCSQTPQIYGNPIGYHNDISNPQFYSLTEKVVKIHAANSPIMLQLMTLLGCVGGGGCRLHSPHMTIGQNFKNLSIFK